MAVNVSDPKIVSYLQFMFRLSRAIENIMKSRYEVCRTMIPYFNAADLQGKNSRWKENVIQNLEEKKWFVNGFFFNTTISH